MAVKETFNEPLVTEVCALALLDQNDGKDVEPRDTYRCDATEASKKFKCHFLGYNDEDAITCVIGGYCVQAHQGLKSPLYTD